MTVAFTARRIRRKALPDHPPTVAHATRRVVSLRQQVHEGANDDRTRTRICMPGDPISFIMAVALAGTLGGKRENVTTRYSRLLLRQQLCQPLGAPRSVITPKKRKLTGEKCLTMAAYAYYKTRTRTWRAEPGHVCDFASQVSCYRSAAAGTAVYS